MVDMLLWSLPEPAAGLESPWSHSGEVVMQDGSDHPLLHHFTQKKKRERISQAIVVEPMGMD